MGLLCISFLHYWLLTCDNVGVVCQEPSSNRGPPRSLALTFLSIAMLCKAVLASVTIGVKDQEWKRSFLRLWLLASPYVHSVCRVDADSAKPMLCTTCDDELLPIRT